jgi:hypothetical protein
LLLGGFGPTFSLGGLKTVPMEIQLMPVAKAPPELTTVKFVMVTAVT